MRTDTEDLGRLPRHFKIRKEIVYAITVAFLYLAGYQFSDWWRYMDWPPFTGTNADAVRTLGCEKLYELDLEEIKKWSAGIDPARAADKRNFDAQPQCLFATYLAFEGSGTRQHVHIVDVEKKRRTARIVFTFDADERALK